MRIWGWLSSVVVTLACTVLLAKLVGATNAPAERPDHRDFLASRLTAEAQLANYATYNAATGETRKFGLRMSSVISCQAAGEHISLPAPTSETDAKWVETMESMQGGDFDTAYLNSLQSQLISIGR